MSIDEKSTYYDAGGIEALSVIKAKLTPEQLQGYYLGNALKYLMRAFYKENPARDVEKARNYVGWLADLLYEQSKTTTRRES